MTTLKEITSGTDIAACAKLASESWSEHYPSIIGAEQTEYMINCYQSATDISREIAENSKYFFVMHDDSVAGYAAYELREDSHGGNCQPGSGGCLYISKLYLKKDFRGLGLSKFILSQFENATQLNGKHKLSLMVDRRNYDSIAVYKRLGFEIVGNVEREIGGGFVLKDYGMEKSLK
jgi:GNAT superfamily N-acetyltransferase